MSKRNFSSAGHSNDEDTMDMETQMLEGVINDDSAPQSADEKAMRSSTLSGTEADEMMTETLPLSMLAQREEDEEDGEENKSHEGGAMDELEEEELPETEMYEFTEAEGQGDGGPDVLTIVDTQHNMEYNDIGTPSEEVNKFNSLLMTNQGKQLTAKEAAAAAKQQAIITEKMKKLAKRRAVEALKKQGVKYQSAWFIFTCEKRKTSEKVGNKVGEQMKQWSEEFKAMAPENKAVFEKRAAKEKEEYEKLLQITYESELEKVEQEGPACVAESTNNNMSFNPNLAQIDHAQPLILPLARVRKISKMDPGVKNVSKEAALSITKATELFVTFLALKGGQVAASRGAKSIMEKDFIHMIHTTSSLEFLKSDFPRRNDDDISRNKPASSLVAQNEKERMTKKSKMAEASKGSSSLTSFFGGGAKKKTEKENDGEDGNHSGVGGESAPKKAAPVVRDIEDL